MHETDLLETEQRDPRAPDLDIMDTIDILRWMNREDMTVPQAVAAKLPIIADAVSTIVMRLEDGGRLFYVGAGTSGRLGMLDAYECTPTFGTPPELVQSVLAGGVAALQADEAAEDREDEGRADLEARKLRRQDVVVGIAASGRTPYVLGALQYAKSIGAATVALSCVTHSLIGTKADISIEVPVGPEVITGSTRLKAGTAQKMVLNMLSTTVMIRLGKVYSNLMLDMIPSNSKLVRRAARMIAMAADVDLARATEALQEANFDIKNAMIMLLADTNADKAAKLLAQADGQIRKALAIHREGESL